MKSGVKSAEVSPELEPEGSKRVVFQRSISEIGGGAGGGDYHDGDGNNRVVMTRRRNNSGGVAGGCLI